MAKKPNLELEVDFWTAYSKLGMNTLNICTTSPEPSPHHKKKQEKEVFLKCNPQETPCNAQLQQFFVVERLAATSGVKSKPGSWEKSATSQVHNWNNNRFQP